MTKPHRPIGYEWLRTQYQIESLPHYRTSSIIEHGGAKTIREGGKEHHLLPSQYDPGPSLGGQLEFALKHEGLNLEMLAALFERESLERITEVVNEKPLGQYRRRIWYLYEFLTGERLPLPDLRQGNYVPLADPDRYVVSRTPRRSSRHRINVNLLGGRGFIPAIRKTEALQQAQARKYDELARRTIRDIPPEVLARAVSYLYTKETKSSFQIEHEEPDVQRISRFVKLLRDAERKSFAEKGALIELQSAIVDPRFAASDYRSVQSYVGATHAFGREEIHYVCPKPEDVPSLMEGLIAAFEQMSDEGIDPVLCAAVLSFGFVFIHPFDDGNGRIHRFLIHNVLARTGYAPSGVIFPVSASMLQQMREYDEILESFSVPLQSLVNYSLNENGEMSVDGSTDRHYRYMDFTAICEKLYKFVEDTVMRQLPQELAFLRRYDAAKRAIRRIVDLPDQLLDLFVKGCAQNHGRLSSKKRESHFKMLSDEEIRRAESAIAEVVDELGT